MLPGVERPVLLVGGVGPWGCPWICGQREEDAGALLRAVAADKERAAFLVWLPGPLGELEGAAGPSLAHYASLARVRHVQSFL